MARPLRINRIGGIYHVTSRGNARQDIFFNDDDRRRFISQLRDNLETFQVELYAGVLMSNHFHLLIRLTQPNLSKFMQRLLTSYSLYICKTHKRPGHLFQGRFKAKIVEDESYLIRLTRYIHLNPIKTKAASELSAAERIHYLGQYRWSTYPVYIGKSPRPEYLNPDVLTFFGNDKSQAHKNYYEYICECAVQDDEELKQILNSNSYAVGSKGFIKEIESDLAASRIESPKDQDVNFPQAQITLSQINRCVCDYFKVDQESLKQRGRISGRTRRVAIELACRLSGLSQREIGQHYGGVRCQAVSIIRRQFRECKVEDEEKRAVMAVLEILTGQKNDKI